MNYYFIRFIVLNYIQYKILRFHNSLSKQINKKRKNKRKKTKKKIRERWKEGRREEIKEIIESGRNNGWS